MVVEELSSPIEVLAGQQLQLLDKLEDEHLEAMGRWFALEVHSSVRYEATGDEPLCARCWDQVLLHADTHLAHR